MPIDEESFKRVGRATAGAVAVVAAYDGGGERVLALTVSSFVVLSFVPPLAMFAIQHNANSYSAMVEGNAFGVSLLQAGQSEVAVRFASKSPDKALGFGFTPGALLPVPLVPAALAQLECRTEQVFIGGDHAIVVGLIEAARIEEASPLLHFARRFGSFTAL